jgi:hypothetical protein
MAGEIKMNQQANEEKWREEFEKLEVLYTPHPMEGRRDYFEKNSDGEYRWSHIREDWKVYLAACKKRQEEIDRYEVAEQLKKYPTAIPYIVLLEKEIQSLKDELKDLKENNEFLTNCNERQKTYFDENEILKDELKAERVAVDFYAKKGNWGYSERPKTQSNKAWMIVTHDCGWCLENEKFVGGKLARETQAKRKECL